jgi:hypothetical protein
MTGRIRIIGILGLILLSMLSLGAAKHKKLIRVAVIDTGLDMEKYKDWLCEGGHKDFTGTDLVDRMNHGNQVVENLIKYAGNSNYCIIVLKYINSNHDKYATPAYFYALKEAIKLNVDVVNYSGGGYIDFSEERFLITTSGIKFFVAAGNEHRDLNEYCSYYPACLGLDNVVVVGALENKELAPYSNYGFIVTEWEDGKSIDGKSHGTSFATPKATGKYIRSVQ